ncbi:hypothetical protein BpHYR1_009486, partial [Brachionus plicatilis]
QCLEVAPARQNIISKGNRHYIASGLSKKNDTTTYESALKRTSWKSFDVFIRGINMCRVVTPNNQDFHRSKCNCPSYDKKNNCKHTIGVASYFKLYTISLEIKNLPIGEKRKRGAPKKATKALVRIDDGNILVKIWKLFPRLMTGSDRSHPGRPRELIFSDESYIFKEIRKSPTSSYQKLATDLNS